MKKEIVLYYLTSKTFPGKKIAVNISAIDRYIELRVAQMSISDCRLWDSLHTTLLRKDDSPWRRLTSDTSILFKCAKMTPEKAINSLRRHGFSVKKA